MNKKINHDYAIGLILYNPGQNLMQRIEVMIESGLKIYIFDNSPFENENNSTFLNNQSIAYFTAGKNVGLGYALSTICATAYANGFTKLLFLDQDTGISVRTLNFINNFSKSIMDGEWKQYAALVFSGLPSHVESIKDVRLAINSGSLYNLPLLKRIGWFNENYFVDCVDYEFCVRARRSGYKIGLINNTPDFDHITEQPDKLIRIFGKHVLIRKYSTNRIRDATYAYIKLIFGGVLKNKPQDTLFLVKSASIYIANQIIARFVSWRK
jgi:GT2 family glycosyltransferase